MKMTVATCQFPVSSDTRGNFKYVSRQLQIAKERGAHVAHFPEACLTGYAGIDLVTFQGFDWSDLRRRTEEIIGLAGKLRIWVILGSAHPLTGRHKPHNCVYIIDDRGNLVDRYDKMFCAGDRSGKSGDLAHYSSGSHFCVFEIRGVRCGALICHDYRYPELYRQYKKRGVQLIFHSYHAGNISPKVFRAMQKDVGASLHTINRSSTLPGITMPATMQARAANNYMWISCPNSSARQSCWASFFVRPDGVITGRLRRHNIGVLVSKVDTAKQFYDSTVNWRNRAIGGTFHSGKLVRDNRSGNRRRL